MVEFLLGKREQLGFGKESTFGTAVAPTDVFGKNARFEPNLNDNNFQETLGAATDSIQVLALEQGPLSLGGNIIFTPQNWKLLVFVLGNSTDTGADPFTHTFSNDVTLPSFTMERAVQHTTDRVRTYEGCKVNTWALNFDSGAGAAGIGAYATATANIIAEDVNNGTTTTSLTAPTTTGFQFRHAKLTLNTTEVTQLVSGQILVNSNLNSGRVANSTLDRLISEPQPQLRRFTGRFTIRPEDDTFFDFWDAATAIGGTNTLELIRGANDTLKLTFTNLMINSPPDPTNLEGINIVDLNWSATDVAFVAVDSIATYP